MDHPQPDEFIVPVEDDKLAPIACDGDTVIVSNVGAFTPGMYVALRLTAAHDYTMILAQFIRREEHLRAVTFLLAFPNSAHAPIEVSAAAIEAMHVIVEVRRRIARP